RNVIRSLASNGARKWTSSVCMSAPDRRLFRPRIALACAGALFVVACGHDDVACRPGEPCFCAGGDACYLDCTGIAGCTPVCRDPSECRVACGNACSYDCASINACAVTCGEDCKVACSGNSSCDAECGPRCAYSCSDVSNCRPTVGPSSTVTCERVGSCSVKC